MFGVAFRAVKRFFHLPFIRYVLWSLSGVAIIAGLFLGLSSSKVQYVVIKNITITHYFPGNTVNDTSYLQISDGSLYYLQASNFTPSLNPTQLQSTYATLVYDPRLTSPVDVQSTNTRTHLSGSGHELVALVSFDQYGQHARPFVTAGYQQHPAGYYNNQWFIGGGFILLAALLVFASFRLVPSRKQLEEPGTMLNAQPVPAMPPAAMTTQPFAGPYPSFQSQAMQMPGQMMTGIQGVQPEPQVETPVSDPAAGQRSERPPQRGSQFRRPGF